MENEMHFEHWIAELNEDAEIRGYPDRPYTETTGEECWRLYFERGLTPDQALDEHEAQQAGAKDNG
jgi:hypothetical protein